MQEGLLVAAQDEGQDGVGPGAELTGRAEFPEHPLFAALLSLLSCRGVATTTWRLTTNLALKTTLQRSAFNATALGKGEPSWRVLSSSTRFQPPAGVVIVEREFVSPA